MSEIKINDEKLMYDALDALNSFLSKKERSYFFKVMCNRNSMDLIVVKFVDKPSCCGFVEKYILTTETHLKMESEITSIHALLMSIL